ncbi:MAG: rhodanese-like domain-containing protein [Planctomycetota bacterium]
MQLRPAEVAARLAQGEDLVLLDVREPKELRLAALPGVVHIPMAEVPRRVTELDPERLIVVVCHHGVRSARICAYLSTQGFERLANLRGGIDAWSREVDASVPLY